MLAVRTDADPRSLVAAVRDAVMAVDVEQPIFAAATMEQRVADAALRTRFNATLLSLFGFAALALTAVGVYGVVAYSVAERTREIGIRVALGATPRDVAGMVMSQGMAMTAVGIVLGFIGAVFVTRFLAGLLYGIRPGDPLTLVGAATILLGGVGGLLSSDASGDAGRSHGRSEVRVKESRGMRPEHWLFTIPLRLRSLFRWAQSDQDLDYELRDHVERKTEEYVAKRMTQEYAWAPADSSRVRRPEFTARQPGASASRHLQVSPARGARDRRALCRTGTSRSLSQVTGASRQRATSLIWGHLSWMHKD
jgi:hypothetical protein